MNAESNFSNTRLWRFLRHWQRPFVYHLFNSIFVNENVWLLIKILLKIVPLGQINNIPALIQIMAWRRPGGKPLSEPMMVSLLMHICSLSDLKTCFSYEQYTRMSKPDTASEFTHCTAFLLVLYLVIGGEYHQIAKGTAVHTQINLHEKWQHKYCKIMSSNPSCIEP